jgi:hypothetical protein
MIRGIYRYLIAAFVAWFIRQSINAAFGPFGERPLNYINRKSRKVAVKLRLAEERP